MKRILLPLALVLAVVVTVFISCKKDETASTLQLRLTDNPYNAEQVNVDIQQVRVKFREDSVSGWMNLTTNARVYNLLGLQNGVDTLLATGVIPNSLVKEIRFVLGPNNTIKIAGVVYPLTIPSGGDAGLKIKVDKKLAASIDSLIIDFDAALSIKQNGLGAYELRPVLKVK